MNRLKGRPCTSYDGNRWSNKCKKCGQSKAKHSQNVAAEVAKFAEARNQGKVALQSISASPISAAHSSSAKHPREKKCAEKPLGVPKHIRGVGGSTKLKPKSSSAMGMLSKERRKGGSAKAGKGSRSSIKNKQASMELDPNVVKQWSPLKAEHIEREEPRLLGDVLSGLLCIMGLDTNTVNDVKEMGLKQLEESHERTASGLVPADHLDLLESLTGGMVLFLTWQKKLHKVVLCQSVARRYLARKRYLELKEKAEPWKIRNEVFRKLLKREQTYVNNLNVVISVYKPAFADEASKSFRALIKEDDVKLIFGNIEEIYQVHKELLKLLKRLEDKWPFVEGVGEVFLTIAPFLKCYGDYITNFKKALARLSQVSSKDKFESKLEEARAVAHRDYKVIADLRGLLSAPLNQVLGYEGALSTIADNTQADHPDRHSIIHCYGILSSTCGYIRNRIEQAENAQEVERVQQLLWNGTSSSGDSLTDDVNRRFIMEAACNLHKRAAKKPEKEKIHMFLFNDLVILAGTVKSQMKELARAELRKLKVEDQAASNAKGSSSPTSKKYCLVLLSEESVFILEFATQKEKQAVLECLRKLIRTYEENKVFATPLSLLRKMNPKRRVPLVVTHLAEHLESSDAISQQGIFRVSGTLTGINLIMDAFDEAGATKVPESLNLLLLGPHDVACAFKQFFRDLPEPVFPYDLYKPMIEVHERHSDGDTAEYTKRLKKILLSLPEENMEVLAYLLRFLKKVAARSEQNKMGIENLAILFCPNVLRPEAMTIEYSMEAPKVNGVFSFMLSHVDTLLE